jgi:hypothetical protein
MVSRLPHRVTAQPENDALEAARLAS